MASASETLLTEEQDKKAQDSDDAEEGPECAVCLQPCVLPTRLPCRHVFCFLCAKGLALQSRRCAMCRAEIPQDFLDRPELLPDKSGAIEKSAGNSSVQTTAGADHSYAWFYEGRNGWWQYEGRLTADLEAAYQRGERTHDALIAGSLYTLDFNNWVQLRRDDPSRRRRIKRDLASSQHKGVAGIRELASHSDDSTRMTAAFNTIPQAAQQATLALQQAHARGGVGGVQGGRMGLVRGAAAMSSYPWPVPRPSLPSHALPVSSDSSQSSSPDIGFIRPGGVGVEPTGTSQGLQEAASRAGVGLARAFLALTTSEQSSQQQPPLPSPPASMQQRHSTQLTWMPSNQRQVRTRAVLAAPQIAMNPNVTTSTNLRVPMERRRRRRTNHARPASSSSEDDHAS